MDDEKEIPAKVKITNNPDKSLRIDMGLKDFAVLSNSIKIANPKYLKKQELYTMRKLRISIGAESP